MRIVTSEGRFIQGQPLELVAQLTAAVRTEARVAVGAQSRESMLLQLECDRVGRYSAEIGPLFAEFAAIKLLESLEEDGLLLIHR